MIATLVVMVMVILIVLAISGTIFNDVYKIIKLVNNETDVDVIEFDKCVLPYKR